MVRRLARRAETVNVLTPRRLGITVERMDYVDDCTLDRAFLSVAKHLARRFVADAGFFGSLLWRHHGLGMLQAELDEEIRLHFWHPSLVSIGSDEARSVHDHRFDITSVVLAGRIVDEPVDVIEFFPADMPENYATTALWAVDHAKVQATKGEGGSVLLGDVRYRSRQRSVKQAGSSYQIARRTFHRTIVVEPAVTLVHRTNFDKDPARVLGHGRSGIVRYPWSDGGFAKMPGGTVDSVVLRAYDECILALASAVR